MPQRVVVPWPEVADTLTADRLGLDIVVFTGQEPPPELGDVAFFTVAYDTPHAVEPLRRLRGLRVVQALTAGYDHLLPLLPPDVTLCNARGLHDASTAEHAMALILAAQRELPRWVRAAERGHWDHAHTRSLAGSRVLIVGYGSIGAALHRRLAGFDAGVTALARRPRPDQGVHGAGELDALLPAADIVVLITPLTADTHHLLDARRLALLPDDALVVNVARGPVLDTAALLAETGAGRLRAALDVTDPEPLPPGHPLWQDRRVIVTPHVAGGAAAFYPLAREFVADQVRAYVAGRPLSNVVRAADRDQGNA